jgi:hypothetical protein
MREREQPSWKTLSKSTLVGGHSLFVTIRATLCAKEGLMLATKFDPESKFFAPPLEWTSCTVKCSQDCSGLFSHHGYYVRADADYFGLVGLTKDCNLALYQQHQPPLMELIPVLTRNINWRPRLKKNRNTLTTPSGSVTSTGATQVKQI